MIKYGKGYSATIVSLCKIQQEVFIMANNPFGALGGLVKGLSTLMPQDDPNVKLMNAQSELADLQAREESIYAKIGKKAVAELGVDHFGDAARELTLVQMNIEDAQKKLAAAQDLHDEAERKAAEEAERAAAEDAANRCPDCGAQNAPGTKFCSECGAKLATSAFCAECGAQNAPGTKFCGECGNRL